MNNSECIYQKFISSGYKPLQELKLRKNISVSENGVRYIADVKPERKTVVFKVEKDIIKEGYKCDRCILSADNTIEGQWFMHLVELKGRKIRHGIEQLEATLQNPLFNNSSVSKRFARVVGHTIPSSTGNPDIERAKQRFQIKYRCSLKIMKPDQPDTI